ARGAARHRPGDRVPGADLGGGHDRRDGPGAGLRARPVLGARAARPAGQDATGGGGPRRRGDVPPPPRPERFRADRHAARLAAGWLQAWVKVNPVSQLSSTVRGLLLGGPVATHLLWTLVWAVGITVVFAPLAVRAYRRRTG